MINSKYLKVILSTLLMIVGIFILTNHNESIISLFIGGLLILIGLAWIVIGTANEGIKLYKEIVAPHDTKTRNRTAIMILVSIFLVYLLFRYFSII